MPTRTNENQKECFVIMPISDVNGYPEGHFDLVYKNIICPSCKQAGYSPFRADEDRAANMIQLEILRKLLDAPLVICDLSTRNPNVLFELGIRQAFDKPVVLIQEEGTPNIFDISTIRYLEYKKEMQYQDVLATHERLKQAILATTNPDKKGTNSIVKLLELDTPATLPKQTTTDRKELSLEYLIAELKDIKNEIREMKQNQKTKFISSSNDILSPREQFIEALNKAEKNLNYKILDEFNEKKLQLDKNKNFDDAIKKLLIKHYQNKPDKE